MPRGSCDKTGSTDTMMAETKGSAGEANRSENAFPVERKHHVYWQKFSVRHCGCQPVRGAPRHTGDQQLSAAEVAERSQESRGVSNLDQ
jgi:hypothetical protein